MIKFIANLFTKNDWEIIQEITTESQAEQMLRLVDKCPSPNNDYQLDKLTAKKHITILQCKNTGKIKRYVETI